MKDNQNQKTKKSKVTVEDLPPATMVSVNAGEYHRLLQATMSLLDEKLVLQGDVETARKEVARCRAEVTSAQSQESVIKGRLTQVEEGASIMADALKEISGIEHKTDGGDWDEIEEAQSIATKALNEAMDIAGNPPAIQSTCAYCGERMKRGSMSEAEFKEHIAEHIVSCEKRPEMNLLNVIIWLAEEAGIDDTQDENIDAVLRKARKWLDERIAAARAEGAASK